MRAPGEHAEPPGSGRALPKAVISWLDDVLYPPQMYRAGACRVGAEVLQRLLGLDVHTALLEGYIPGEEASIVRAVLKGGEAEGDDRLVAKVAEAMALHMPQVAPYEDALETFGILQVLGISLWLIGEGPARAQRLVAQKLGVERLFQGAVFPDPYQHQYEWSDSLVLLESAAGAMSDHDVVFVCAAPNRAAALARQERCVYFLDRQEAYGDELLPSPHLIRMRNLYELPEALGVVSWSEP